MPKIIPGKRKKSGYGSKAKATPKRDTNGTKSKMQPKRKKSK